MFKGALIFESTLMFKRCLRVLSSLVFFALTQPAALAQFRVEVHGAGSSQIPIAFAPFKNEHLSPQKISHIIRNDLERSGQYKPLNFHEVVDESQPPDLEALKKMGAEALVSGSVATLPNGQFEVRFRLWDVVKNEDLGAKSHVVDAANLRLAAHQISDFVYENLSAEEGVFSTRIAYVSELSGKYKLWISDIDGENAQSVFSSSEPIMSPAWSSDGKNLAYVSIEQRKPVVYVYETSKGTRRAVASFKGSNSAPAWHPNGRSLIVALSQTGHQQLYAVDLLGGKPRRIFSSLNIDTEPVFSADGNTLFFVSDRSGGPQIYRVMLPYGTPERLTFTGTHNTSPAISPNGKSLAYIARIEGRYKLQLLDLTSKVVTSLTDTGTDEHPSFAPNGRQIIYATQEAGGPGRLMTTTVDGRVKSRLTSPQGDIREPSWRPFAAF